MMLVTMCKNGAVDVNVVDITSDAVGDADVPIIIFISAIALPKDLDTSCILILLMPVVFDAVNSTVIAIAHLLVVIKMQMIQ